MQHFFVMAVGQLQSLDVQNVITILHKSVGETSNTIINAMHSNYRCFTFCSINVL